MKKKSFLLLSFWIFSFIVGCIQCVNVHFENKDGGFFLKQSPRQHFTSTPELGGGVSPATSGSPLSTDRFTVFQSSQPISVRATYGPFSTKQTVPARYVVPDPLPLNTTGLMIDLQDLVTHHLDMSAHIVRNEIPRDSPILRVLFHTGTDPGGRRQILLARHHQRVCIVLHATLGTKPTLHAACSPDGEDGVCLAQITIPSSWWPALPSPDKDGRPGKITKTPPRLVQVAYSVLEPRPDETEGCHPKMQIQPTTALGSVPLVPAKGAYKETKLTDAIMMLVPHPPLFPKSRMHIPVFIDKQKAKLLTAIVIRARVKSGVRLLEASASGAASWNITVDINPRHTGASVTLVRKEPPDSEVAVSDGDVIELFTWLIEVGEDDGEQFEGARIVWSARFEPHQDEMGENGAAEMHRSEGRKSTTRFEVQKDDIQAVVPISKNWEVLNTAVLTGRQVSQAMKVFIVSQAGKAADVTFQASCHSEDDSVLKVSSSCSSVYVDGSEARGSVNGSVSVKYGTYIGLARFTVWMPEFPLDLQVSDTRLSQLKSWRVPDYHPSGIKNRRKKRSYSPNNWSAAAGAASSPDDLGNIVEKPVCRLRYQQSPVDIYAHFMASDHDSGRISYLINRRTWLRVTDLVLPLLRVSDPRIASLHGRILQGRSMGRTEVQVLSPITGRVIGAKEIRVGNDKVGLSRLSVQVVSGLQLNISPDSSIENGYLAETSVTRKLTAQYQEGLLDIELEFSDGSKTPLRDIADTDYHLVVESLDPEVVAFAPMVASHHPRVIAVGEGNGDLLQVTLLLPEECRNTGRPKINKGAGPLATASASVTVDFTSSDLQHRPDLLQNDGGSSYGSGKQRDFQDLQDILKGTPLKDAGNAQEPNVQARQYQGKGILRQHRHNSPAHMTPLEISMYVLLAAFCCAIVVFVVSCVVYASKFKVDENGAVTQGVRASPVNPTANVVVHRKAPRETITNAHDWVWLGRATLDNSNRNSAATTNGGAGERNEMIRITANPLNMNYCDPDDCLATSFSNPTHIELPSRAADAATSNNNSNTYVKNKATVDDVQVWNKPTPPPPLPPHGVQSPIHSERVKSQQQQPIEDYRPPVPPHRNIGITTNSNSLESTPQRKQHHHHHHHRNSRHQRAASDINNARNEELVGLMSSHGGQQDAMMMRSVFEFDDEPSQAPPKEIVRMRSKTPKINDNNDDNVEFVQYPKSPNSNVRNSAEVKRATIVGNPMFSSSNDDDENDGASGEGEAAADGTSAVDLPGLDDLQLDMDYEQIMHYFDNLKESNA